MARNSTQSLLLFSARLRHLPLLVAFVIAFGWLTPALVLTVSPNSVTVRFNPPGLLVWGTACLALLCASCRVKGTAVRRIERGAYRRQFALVVGVSLIAAVSASKLYWGYFFTAPSPLSQTDSVEGVVGAVPVFLHDRKGQGWHFEADDRHGTSELIATAELEESVSPRLRLLSILEKRGILTGRSRAPLFPIPRLYPLISDAGLLPPPNTLAQGACLSGVLLKVKCVDASTVFLLALSCDTVLNDHFYYCEAAIGAEDEAGPLKCIAGERFYYDIAGFEAFRWYVIWVVLLMAGLAGMAVFRMIEMMFRDCQVRGVSSVDG